MTSNRARTKELIFEDNFHHNIFFLIIKLKLIQIKTNTNNKVGKYRKVEIII